MRHLKKKGKLGMKTAPRKALLRGLATSLVLAGRIETTAAKAKVVKPIIEKYITLSKVNSLVTRRRLIQYFYKEKAINKLLTELGPKYQERKGGYTRIIRLANRRGDNAPKVLLELV